MKYRWIRETGQIKKFYAARILFFVLGIPMALGFLIGVGEHYLEIWIGYSMFAAPAVIVLYFFSIRCPNCGAFPFWRLSFIKKQRKVIPPIGAWDACFFCGLDAEGQKTHEKFVDERNSDK